MEIPIYELRDMGATVLVKPCRRCYERSSKIIETKFEWWSDDIAFINMYRVYCPVCDHGNVSGMEAPEWSIDELQGRWNDWEESFEEWEEDLDW